MRTLSRRTFLGRMTAAAAGPLLAQAAETAGPTVNTWRAAIVGATGQGDYGHGLDVVFQNISQVQVVAVADPDSGGRARAAKRTGAPRQYADYRQMLAAEKPDLVVIAPRWSERHSEMAMAALSSGAHLLTEKPFTASLAEADAILDVAKRSQRKIAVAHQMRLAPSIIQLRQAVADGPIGELLQMRAWGKQDARAGGEDLIVLGTHIFDMMRLFAGDAISCTAQIFNRGHPVTRVDVRQATERIGPIIGDEIEAQYLFANGVTASFTSRARLRETFGPWAVELMGSNGVVRILMDIDPVVLHRRRTSTPPGVTEEWQPLPVGLGASSSAVERGFGPANRRVVTDWLNAISNDRDPQCSGYNAMKALEFAMAAFQAGLIRESVPMPLAIREHPLS